MNRPKFEDLDPVQQGFALACRDAYVNAWLGRRKTVVTVSGPGGTGKTATIAVALDLIEQWLRERRDRLLARNADARDPTADPQFARALLDEARGIGDRMADMTRRMLMDAAVAKKQTASDRKDDELLAQAEALAFVLAETEETNIDF